MRSVPFLLGLIGLFAFILINTFSRSAWGGFIVGGIYLVFSPGFVRKRYLALIMIATLILVSTYMPVILNRVETLEDTEYGGRLPEIETGLRYFSDAPLNGIGIGNYKPTILEERLAMRQYIAPGAAHNVFVKTLAETGLVGTLLYLWVWFVLLRLALRNERLAPTKELYWANRGFVACLLATLVSSFSQGTLYFNLWWVMLGLFAVLSDFIGQVSATGKKSEAKPVVGVLIREYPA
jgi:O-antigen ligase